MNSLVIIKLCYYSPHVRMQVQRPVTWKLLSKATGKLTHTSRNLPGVIKILWGWIDTSLIFPISTPDNSSRVIFHLNSLHYLDPVEQNWTKQFHYYAQLSVHESPTYMMTKFLPPIFWFHRPLVKNIFKNIFSYLFFPHRITFGPPLHPLWWNFFQKQFLIAQKKWLDALNATQKTSAHN